MIKAGFNAIYCHDSYICNKYNVVIPIEEKEEFGEAFIEPIKQVLYVGEV